MAWKGRQALLILLMWGGQLARGDGGATCEISTEGRELVVDDTGTICSHWDVDPSNLCCTKGDKLTCDTCHIDDKCCSSFQHCVSCCLRPEHDAKKLMSKETRALGRSNTGMFVTPFQYCTGRCRTTGNSTSHENSYIGARHFCFSSAGRPWLDGDSDDLPNLPPNVVVVTSKEGQSCSSACSHAQLSCVSSHLAAVNSCNHLRKHFMCEAGCDEASGESIPAYISDEASKQYQPAKCFYQPQAGAKFHCDTAKQLAMRLCTCMAGHEAKVDDESHFVDEHNYSGSDIGVVEGTVDADDEEALQEVGDDQGIEVED